ncbi:MAG: NAD(P)-dependent dehydrogenase (short-subunit alcohol dehydrogenase family) [Limisphaerales bacterium]|jgi:NAD(P)-dependent dehydrogenase (short-subunit alcohol dehydrogenase family)
MFEKAKTQIPARRFGTVEEVANAVCFLSSPLSNYINGICLYVDGAQHLSYDGSGLSTILRSFT